MIKHLYIHIPFCKYICSYCDFCKKYVQHYNIDEYLDLLDQELSLYQDEFHLDTIYVGGGTPSTLNINQLNILKNIINKHTKLNDNYEFSFEANPDDITDEYAKALHQIGVNRLSIGVQTLNNDILKQLGREYQDQDVYHALDIASNYFDNISIDLMFNLKNQTLEDIDKAIELVNRYTSIKHISVYSLIVEDHTILGNQDYYNLDEDQESQVYKYIQNKLKNLGFNQYEISNWFRSNDYISKHNSCYWDNSEYVGIGLSASSYYKNYRYTNTRSYKDYLITITKKNNPIVDYEQLSNYDKIYYSIMLGLRTSRGINYDLVKDYISDINQFEIIDKNIRIKEDYYFISNEIIIDILIKLEESWQE